MADKKQVQQWIALAQQSKTHPIFQKNFPDINKLIDRLIVKGEKWLKENADKVVSHADVLLAKIAGFKAALKFAKGKQKEVLSTKIKGFEAALKFTK